MTSSFWYGVAVGGVLTLLAAIEADRRQTNAEQIKQDQANCDRQFNADRFPFAVLDVRGYVVTRNGTVVTTQPGDKLYLDVPDLGPGRISLDELAVATCSLRTSPYAEEFIPEPPPPPDDLLPRQPRTFLMPRYVVPLEDPPAPPPAPDDEPPPTERPPAIRAKIRRLPYHKVPLNNPDGSPIPSV